MIFSQVSSDHRPEWSGHRVHPQRVQGPQDHQDLVPRRLVPQEPGVCPPVRQPVAGPGRRELRSNSQPCPQQVIQSINDGKFLLNWAFSP